MGVRKKGGRKEGEYSKEEGGRRRDLEARGRVREKGMRNGENKKRKEGGKKKGEGQRVEQEQRSAGR